MIACVLMTTCMIQAIQGVLDAPQLDIARGLLEKDTHRHGTERTIEVLWTDASSIIGTLEEVTYDIEVFYTGQEYAVHSDSVERRPSLTLNGTHSWMWTSPLPLQCLSHSVRIRARHRADISDWTQPKEVEGSGSDGHDVYPKDDVVLAGSRKKFCCIIPKGAQLKEVEYRRSPVQSYTRVEQTYIVEVTLVPSSRYGDAVSCVIEGDQYDTHVFVGYSPEVHNFTCETRNLNVLQCSWIQGDDNLVGPSRKTNYTLNGRSCENSVQCSVKISAHQEDVMLLLTAENKINRTHLNYTTKPRYRVYLESPRGLNVLDLTSRSARLDWAWPAGDLQALPMRCQILCRGEVACEDTEETGEGLHNVEIRDLHPYTNYSVKVRCASAEHFWKWGDWSKAVSFVTKEDRPQPVDVWATVDTNKSVFVMWKELSVKDSHGKILDYELSWDGSSKTAERTQQCVIISSGEEKRRVSVIARNSAGSSPPSTIITLPSPSPLADVKEVHALSGSNGSLELSWRPEAAASCGYVLDWIPVNSQDTCDLMWKKIPAGHNSTTIKSAPNEAPGSVLAKQDGLDVVLSWNEIPVENRRGFIQEYLIKYYPSSHQNIGPPKTRFTAVRQGRMQEKFEGLLADTYEFSISAKTSAGEGPASKTKITVTSQTHQMIVKSIVSLGFAILLVIIFAFLLYRKRTWLKERFYPPIPAPRLDCSTSHGIYNCELLQIAAENVEHTRPCKLEPAAGDEMFLSSFPVTEVDDGAAAFDNTVYLLANAPGNEQDSCWGQPAALSDKATYQNIPAPNSCVQPPNTRCTTTAQCYSPQSPPVHTEVLPCSDSYQTLQDACQEKQPGGPQYRCDCEDHVFSAVVHSPISVSSSQPLIGDVFDFMGNTLSDLGACSDSYQALHELVQEHTNNEQ
ncbi:leukemia inhibitory factor receptor-like isoform X2 [Engraulis encrasicolus]|uniref:leukemia inhibitory factor receptor-like isoform X2 n=1 Tax=Engraulis encrasicolus TaxID=184585 RepID=UPI002FD44466